MASSKLNARVRTLKSIVGLLIDEMNKQRWEIHELRMKATDHELKSDGELMYLMELNWGSERRD